MWGAQGWNQWALQPAMFNDVPHEQIDWAALAKQWIQMQQTQPADPVVTPILPPIPTPVPATTGISIVPPPPPPPGHGPVLPEEFPSESPINVSHIKPPVPPAELSESFTSDPTFDTDPPGGFVQKPSSAYWNKSHWEPNTAPDVDERMWTGPPIEPAIIGGKETYDYGHMHDNPPLAMQSIDYNHMSEFSYNQVYPTESQYDQYWSQVNAAPPISPMFLKKDRVSSATVPNTNLHVEEDASQIDAAKRKHLPAWIREGLEKMEQERIKKLNKEKSDKEKAEKLAEEKLKKIENLKDDGGTSLPMKSKFDSDSDNEVETTVIINAPNKNIISKRSPSPIEDIRTEEEKRQEYMLNIRRILTEVLLTVTNAEMYAIAEEVIRKEQLKARQLASTASLTSVASGLRSLANYGSESEASAAEEDNEESDSDEELYRRIREKKKLFAIKEKKIIAELEKKELEEQNEALKEKNDIISTDKESIPESKELEKSTLIEEVKPVIFGPPADAPDEVVIPFLEEKIPVESADNISKKELKKPVKKHSHSSGSSSSSSENESDSNERDKKKLDNNEPDKSKDSDKLKTHKKEISPKKHHRHRSSDSDSSDHHTKSSRSRDKNSKKSSSHKKKKKYKRSDSSSSSSDSGRRRKYSSKSDSSHNHRERRSRSYDDRDRGRRHRSSVSPRNYRSSRDSHRSKESYSHRHEKEKYSKRDKEKYDYKRTPSPHYKRSSKLPKKYRSSRSPSSDYDNSGRKSKKYRAR